MKISEIYSRRNMRDRAIDGNKNKDDILLESHLNLMTTLYALKLVNLDEHLDDLVNSRNNFKKDKP